MKLWHRCLLGTLAACSLAGCIIVARPVRPGADNVVVYSVDSPPPVRPAAWRRSFQFVYYPRAQVYFAPHRNCYIWKGPRGWKTTPAPPPNVVLKKDDCVAVELENDDPVACHAEVEAQVAHPGKSRRAQRTADASTR